MSMMGGHVVVVFFVVPCGFAMVASGVFVMFGGVMMMLGCFFGHVILLCGMRKSRAAEGGCAFVVTER
jgi:ABC-type cobalamin transport system permease subunit